MIAGILLITLIIVFLSYVILLLYYASALTSKPFVTQCKPIEESCSIIICVRNEEGNIKTCVESIFKQDFPPEQMEVILVNDHSTDNTMNVLHELIQANPTYSMRVLSLNTESGKKAGIAMAVGEARFNIIICTDADCVWDESHLKKTMQVFVEQNADFIAGPVLLHHHRGVIQFLQRIENYAMQAFTASAFIRNRAGICNGANMSFRRDTFLAIGGYASYSNISSGDDVFLLHQFKKFKKSIKYSFYTVVHTKAVNNAREYLQQRLRWAGKSTHYRDIHTLQDGTIVMLANTGLLLLLFFSIFYTNFVTLFIILFAIKTLVDINLVIKFTTFMGEKIRIIDLIIFQVYYLLYLPLLLLLLPFAKVKWKDRVIK